MSLTSYRAAPPRDTAGFGLPLRLGARARRQGFGIWRCEWVLRGEDLLCATPASMPGDDLLFHCLSNSTIGAVWFHGRVRDGIGWGTDAIVTKQ